MRDCLFGKLLMIMAMFVNVSKAKVYMQVELVMKNLFTMMI